MSVALHAMALWQAPPPAVSRASQPLVATLRQFVGEEAARSEPAQPRVAASAVHAATHAESPAPPAAQSDAGPVTPQEAQRSEPSERLAPAATAANAGPDAEGLRLYRLNLAAAARRFKHYPALAADRGLSGRAEVTVAVAANGMAQPPQLASSSGHDLLDAAAIDMIARAVQATNLPQKLRGQAFAIRLPVLFDIEEE